MPEFYTKICFEISGKLEDLQKLVDIHEACADAHRNPGLQPGDLVRSAFPEWTGEEDYINPVSITVKLIDDTKPYVTVDDCEGYADIDYIARLLQGWLRMCDGNGVIAFEYSHDASRSVSNAYGGGAVAVSRDAIQMVDTSELLDLMREGRYLTLDQGGTVEVKEHLGMVGPGIVWTQDWNGWSAYIDHPGTSVPLHQTGSREIFGDDDQAAAAKTYEDWLQKTTMEYWDCECEHNYMHPKTETKCGICLAEQEHQPDSRIGEVLKAGLQLKVVDILE